MKVPVAWFRTDSSWDVALPRFILDGAAECHHDLVKPEMLHAWPAFCRPEIAVFVIPGRHSCKDYFDLNEAAGDFKRVVFIIYGDEEADFQADRLEHPNKKIWYVMPPFNPKQEVDRVAPNGWTTGTQKLLAIANGGDRVLPWSFAGQVTHRRRFECEAASRLLPKEGIFIGTQGFTQGLPRDMYYELMLRSKFVLCPSGPCTPDSFRFAEALEAGAIPIVDNCTPNPTYPRGYWKYVFGGGLPFPVVEEWEALPDHFGTMLENYERLRSSCMTWWDTEKKLLIAKMKEDLDVRG